MNSIEAELERAFEKKQSEMVAASKLNNSLNPKCCIDVNISATHETLPQHQQKTDGFSRSDVMIREHQKQNTESVKSKKRKDTQQMAQKKQKSNEIKSKRTSKESKPKIQKTPTKKRNFTDLLKRKANSAKKRRLERTNKANIDDKESENEFELIYVPQTQIESQNCLYEIQSLY